MKDSFRIEGLAGAHTLKGELAVSGAKNDAIKAVTASFLFADELKISNVPTIADIAAVKELVKNLGATFAEDGDTLTISTQSATQTEFSTEIAKRLRASIVLTGAVLARFGEVSFPHPGGCVIGARPIDLFLSAFEKMGATYEVGEKFYRIKAKDEKLKGADIFLDIPSVGVTETVMMAAVLADGVTTIRNAAMEPEIQNLAQFLASSGASISGIGTPTLSIEGGELLRANGKEYKVIPDRIEAGSFAILAALAAEEVHIKGINLEHLRSLFSLFEKAGVDFSVADDVITVRGGEHKAVNIKTHEYPGFPTDLQAPMTVFLTQAEGEGLVFETMFEGRLHYTEDLVRMGADITMFDPHRVLVRGPKTFRKGARRS